MKTCKQCGRYLDEEQFRSYVPRGKGVYKTSVGRNTICKDCESLNAKVARYAKSEETPERVAFLNKAAALYRELHARGLEPVGAYARIALGLSDEVTPRRRTDEDLFDAILGKGDPLTKHLMDIRTRTYASLDEAITMHLKIKEDLKTTGTYEARFEEYKEADTLLEDWEEEEEDGIYDA